MAIWFSEDYQQNLSRMNKYLEGYISERLGVEYIEIGEDWVKAQMPCVPITHNPSGIMHGGAISLFADTVGGISCNFCVDLKVTRYVTLNLSINFLSSVREGRIYAVAKPVHIGKSTAVTNVEVTCEDGKLLAVARLTMGNYLKNT